MSRKLPLARNLLVWGLLLGAYCPAPGHAAEKRANLRLWFGQPAQDWEKEALPIGNGRLGAMVS